MSKCWELKKHAKGCQKWFPGNPETNKNEASRDFPSIRLKTRTIFHWAMKRDRSSACFSTKNTTKIELQTSTLLTKNIASCTTTATPLARLTWATIMLFSFMSCFILITFPFLSKRLSTSYLVLIDRFWNWENLLFSSLMEQRASAAAAGSSMISLVSCSENGNHVPSRILEENEFHLLIPRWSDRLEAVGTKGVVRCYQYNQESGLPLSSADSPRARTIEEVWQLASPQRFQEYQRTGESKDMISHYYDKLLHVACPPKRMVQNAYLEKQAEASSEALLEVCLRYGRTGVIDESYLQRLARMMEKS